MPIIIQFYLDVIYQPEDICTLTFFRPKAPCTFEAKPFDTSLVFYPTEWDDVNTAVRPTQVNITPGYIALKYEERMVAFKPVSLSVAFVFQKTRAYTCVYIYIYIYIYIDIQIQI